MSPPTSEIVLRFGYVERALLHLDAAGIVTQKSEGADRGRAQRGIIGIQRRHEPGAIGELKIIGGAGGKRAAHIHAALGPNMTPWG